VLGRRDATTESPLGELLERQGVDDQSYSAYVRGSLLVDAFRDHFADEVVGSETAQRRVAQILIATPAAAAAVPQERARHVLVNPLPEDAAQDAEATDEQWAAALEEAEEVHQELSADDADWFTIAEERSDDPGSGARGGDLGWYDPTASPFVPEFAEALEALEVGELSDPVRSDFGYHVIQKTGERASPQAQATELVEELRADPDAFVEVATRVSEDYATAEEGGVRATDTAQPREPVAGRDDEHDVPARPARQHPLVRRELRADLRLMLSRFIDRAASTAISYSCGAW